MIHANNLLNDICNAVVGVHSRAQVAVEAAKTGMSCYPSM